MSSDLHAPVLEVRSKWMIVMALCALMTATAAIFVKPSAGPVPATFTERIDTAVAQLQRTPAKPDPYLTLSELALDLRIEERGEVWTQSAETARHLAPILDATDLAIIRGGFVHWYELNEMQREIVLDSAGRLLADENHYRNLWRPVLEATRSPAFLAAHAPRDQTTMRQIETLAATWGDLVTHRRMQRIAEESLRASLPSMDGLEMLDTLQRLEVGSPKMLQAAEIFRELRSRDELQTDQATRISALKDRWRPFLPDVGGEPPENAREPEVLELPVETQMPRNTVWRLGDRTPSRITIEAERTDELSAPAAIEVWVDGRLRDARIVTHEETIDVPLHRGDQLLELRLASSRTRNNEPFRLHVTLSS